MGTSVLLRRLEGDADLRNYVLNNAWPNYVPGESPETEVLEVKVKNFGAAAARKCTRASPIRGITRSSA